MNIRFFRKILCASSLLAMSAFTFAVDNKTFIGSACSFADNPLASHNKIHHRLTNTSGRSQWVTCPVVRDFDGVEWVGLDTVGTASYVRFEQRAPLNGSLTGWNASGSTITSSTGRQYYWFNGSTWANGVNSGYYAIEVYLGNNAYINGYRVTERT